MTLVDRAIASLREHHDRLAALVPALDEAALTGPSAATQWRVSDVLSHLGSGAEIMLRPVAAAIAHTDAPEAANQEVWDRWDETAPAAQSAGFLEHDARLVETLEGLGEDDRETLVVDLGFLPAPVPLAMAVGMRLNEVALHTWDVVAGLEGGDATVDEEAADILLDLLAGPLGMLMHWAGKPDLLEERAVVAFEGHGLVVADDVVLVDEPPIAPTAWFVGPVEAAVRLISGRLGPEVTPEGVEVSGNVTLDDLRRVFPGY